MNQDLIRSVEAKHLKSDTPDFGPGDTLRVSVKVVEGNRERVQAFEGVVIGSVLGILTTWLMYEKSAMFAGIHTGFPVMWGTAAVLAAITLAASLAATFGPARRAAHILPALATRVSE